MVISLWTILTVLAAYIIVSYLNFKIAKQKNRNAVGWTVGGILTNPILFLIILSLLPKIKK